MGSGVENLQKNINIDHRDISNIFNNIVPNIYWTANYTAMDMFPELPDVEDIFPVVYWRYNCSAEYYGHTNTTLFCAVQGSWQDMVKFFFSLTITKLMTFLCRQGGLSMRLKTPLTFW